MSLENIPSQEEPQHGASQSGIVTPRQARAEGQRQDQKIVVNSAGDTKEAGSDTVTTPTGETYTPTPNQNEVDLRKYREVNNEVDTDSVTTPDGKRIYRQGVDSKNTGVAHDLESGQWMETRHSKEAPEKDSFVSAERVSEGTITARNQATQDLEGGGAKWRNDRGQFSKKGEGRLDATGQQIEQARNEMNAAQRDQHSETLDRNREANEGLIGSTPPSSGMTEALRGVDEKANAIKQQIGRNRKHQEALDSNKKANEGFIGSPPPSKGMSKGLKHMDQTTSEIREQGEREEGGASEPEITTVDPTTPEETGPTERSPLSEIGERLVGIDERLNGIQGQLDGLNAMLTEAQANGELNTEQLLEMMMEQNRLFTEQAQLQSERFEALLQQQSLQQGEFFRTLLDRLGDARPEGTTPEEQAPGEQVPGEAEPENIPPAEVIDSDRIAQLQNEHRELQESRRNRERKEKIIKIVAGVAGGAIALASPPVSIAAVIGVTVGGRLLGKGLKKWSEKLRSKSNSMKYEDRGNKTAAELYELDKEIQRKEWWADRLGEASAVTLGGSAGYGLGKAIQNIFGWEGIGGGNTPPEGGAPGGEGGTPGGAEGGGDTPPNLETPPEGDIGGGPEEPFELPQNTESVGGGIGEAEYFNASDYGWNAEQLGWTGDRIALGAHGSAEGTLQKEFFGELFDLVPKEKLMGQAAGNTANQFLRQAYNGADPTQAAQSAAQALLGQ